MESSTPEMKDLYKKARNIALRYLSHKNYCSYDLDQKLRKHIESDDIRKYIIESMIDSGIINDSDYAKTLAYNLIKYKHKGMSYVGAVLAQKKLSHILKDPLLLEDLERVENSGLKQYMNKIGPRLSQDKLIKHLMSKGYGLGKIKRYLTMTYRD